MFFIIPFGIFIVSSAAIIYIVSRKFVYLRKLTPEVIENADTRQESFFAEFFPGLAARLQGTKLREYRLMILAESEKILRKLRLFSLKLDTATNQLIHRVRTSTIHHEGVLNEQVAMQEDDVQENDAVDEVSEELRRGHGFPRHKAPSRSSRTHRCVPTKMVEYCPPTRKYPHARSAFSSQSRSEVRWYS